MNPSINQQQASSRQGGYSEWIDIFRGLAAMWVILYHSRADLWVGFHKIRNMPGAYSHLDRLLAWLSLPATCGGSAVMLFFLISGFCVHLPYAGNNRPFNVTEYGIRRTFRILPPYLFAVLLTCVLEWLAYALGGASPTPWPLVGRVALLTQNYGAHGGQLLTNGSLWSLPVEVELYIAFLLFYFFLKKTGRWFAMTMVSILSLIGAAGCFFGMKDLGQNFLFFWAIWCAGALLAEGHRRGCLPRFKIWNGATLLLLATAAVWGESHQWHLAILTYLWAGAYFHALWLALLNPGFLLRFPRRLIRLLIWLGTISYSAYLVHGPFFAFSGFLWQHVASGKSSSYLVPLLFSVLVWPGAWLFWRFCELPFHQMAQRMAQRNQSAPLAARKSPEASPIKTLV